MDYGQPYTTVDVDKDKPKQYQNRKLRAEKTGEKKFNFSRRVFQNTITHYNYFFNADNKLNDIVTQAKSLHKDDYTQLLSFYNYSLEATSQQKQQLDSVIYKCNAGILLHDLRNDWIDDMYLLLGKAFLFKKNFDSAAQVFQYINYIYAPKDDGYDIPIGSNASNTNGIFTVSTQEKGSWLKKMTSKPPVRNDSFLWQVRNYLEQDKLVEASGLLSILRSDSNFPPRLQTDKQEMIAYLFYKQQLYDSSASYLQKTFSNATDQSEVARREYLCGQMYQLAGKNETAIALFNRASAHTSDPYMDVYAKLNMVNLSSSGNKENVLQQHLAELYRLAKRDKFENYRDIIYYAAAILELQQKNRMAAQKDLSKSIQFSVDNPQQKQKSFLLLADINYDSRDYTSAYNFYDSIQTNQLSENEAGRVNLRRPALKIITENLSTIHLQDSLLALSLLPEAERLAAVKKIYKKIRKTQGLKDSEEADFGNSLLNSASQTGLFNNKTTSGDFYFSNSTQKMQGYQEFKSLWGNRPNVDNWQRQSGMSLPGDNAKSANPFNANRSPSSAPIKAIPNKEISLESLLANIPMTSNKITVTNNSIAAALLKNGETFQNNLEDYDAARECFETLLHRFPGFASNEQSLFDLAYCYKKTGAPSKFDSIKNLLNATYPEGKWTIKINNGTVENRNSDNVAVVSNPKEVATREYEDIYNLFIEGRFQEAESEKQEADKQYGKNYWTPQLLYIESIYYVKQKQDSIAINRLQSIISTFASSPLAEKAKTMVEVLKRRKEIEAYLTNLQIDKNEDTDMARRVNLSSTDVVAVTPQKLLLKDTMATIKVLPKEIKGIPPARQEVRPVTATGSSSFTFVPADPHYAVIILDKVDEVFVSEARNAFGRYNREKFYNQKINITPLPLTGQYNMILLGPFASAGDAVNYIDNVRASVSSRIIPWLTKDKYSFSIISNANLIILKTNKDVDGYHSFIKQIFSDKF
jgi:hypothetical protein